MERVGEILGIYPMPIRQHWPGDASELNREFLASIVADRVDRLREPGTAFEAFGAEWARGGGDFEVLASGMRMATRITHTEVHRALLQHEAASVDPDGVVEVLDRIYAGGEEVIASARVGFESTRSGHRPDDAARRLGGLLLHGGEGASELAREIGWDDEATISAIVTSPQSAEAIRQASDCRVAYFPRSDDVVLLHPVAEDKLATTLRPLLTGHTCTVGPALPMLDAARSLDLAARAGVLRRGRVGVVFADDIMLEIASSADRVVVDSLRRTYLSEVDELPAEQRGMLLETLLEWLRQWGQRAKVAEVLGVHPQTVSHRINRLRDLMAVELEESTVRAELLVLLTAMSVRDAWPTG